MVPVRPRVRVLVLQHGLGALDYAVPPGLVLAAGDIVRVPLGPREILGAVWEAESLPAKDVPDAKLRAVTAVIDGVMIPAPLRRLVEFVADYYLAQPSAVLRMTLPSQGALEPPRGDVVGAGAWRRCATSVVMEAFSSAWQETTRP